MLDYFRSELDECHRKAPQESVLQSLSRTTLWAILAAFCYLSIMLVAGAITLGETGHLGFFAVPFYLAVVMWCLLALALAFILIDRLPAKPETRRRTALGA
jgi:hypothetical protein